MAALPVAAAGKLAGTAVQAAALGMVRQPLFQLQAAVPQAGKVLLAALH
jgi:hypothetical protein